jgi:hypothetical protein
MRIKLTWLSRKCIETQNIQEVIMKKEYEKPELVEYEDLAEITTGGISGPIEMVG